MRRFEFRDGKSSKFWAIGVDGTTITTSWGRLGTAGQTKSKDYSGGEEAKKDADKQIAAKIAKGYAEVGIAPTDEVAALDLDLAAIPSVVPDISIAVPSAPGMGLVLGIASDGDHVVAVGGQGRDLFYSSLDGGKSFIPKRSPGTGLRGALVRGNDIWTCGEWGFVGHSPDRGQTWTKLKSGAKACLFGIVADRQGTLWVAGDDGFVARSRDGRRFEQVNGLTESMGRLTSTADGVLIPTDDGNLYLANDDGFTDLGLRAGTGLMKAIVTPCGTTMVVGQGCVFRAPQGESFSKVAGDFFGLMCGIAAFEDGRVVVVGQSGKVLVSFDDGVSFRVVSQNLSSDYLWCCEQVYDTLLVGCHHGVVLRIGTPAERAPVPLPPLPTELATKEAGPTNPAWAAPGPSTAEQKWVPPTFETEVRDGIFLTPKFRFMLYPRRGGVDVGVRPLPTEEEAWAAFRRAIWASDRSYTDAKEEPSRLWKLMTSADARHRAVGERILDPRPRRVSEELDRQLFDLVTRRYHGIVHEFSEQVYTRLTDVLVTTNGLVEGLRRALLQLDELPYLGVGPFGRFRELLAITEDETYAAARDVAVKIIDELPPGTKARQVSSLRWATTFMFPLGPAAGPIEQQLHDAALANLGDYGNSNVHAAGIAAGGIDTLERFMAAQRPVGAGHQFFGPFNYRMYLTSVLELEGSKAADVFARLKPQPPWTDDAFYNAIWCSLLGHIDSPVALEAMLAEYNTPTGEAWGLSTLTEAAQIDPDRVLDFLRARGPAELVEEVAKALRTTMPPVPVSPADAVLFGDAATPTHYSPPEATHPTLTPPTWAPATTFKWDDEARAEALGHRARPEFETWEGNPVGGANAGAVEAFVSHREKWRLPTSLGLLTIVPQRFHKRLMALGFNFGAWGTGRFLAPLLLEGGSSYLPALAGALEDSGTMEQALATAKHVGDMSLVPPIAAAFAGKKNKSAATSWLLRFPTHAAAGAAQMLADNPKDKDAPRVLRFVAARGHRDIVEQMAGHAGVAKAVGTLLDSDPLTPAVRKKLKIPSWATADALPPLVDSQGGKATVAQTDEEIARLAFSNPVEPHPLVPTARERWTRSSLEEFAWATFEAWLGAGGDAKEQWALQAVGFWGGDDAARKLTALAKAWPGQGLGKRAQWAIEALANIGTDAALANINLLAEKSRFPAFKTAAAQQIGDIAAGRGLTTDELADRLVPTLDLDDDNASTLNFGDRSFAIVFDESLTPVLRDEDGKVLANPPKPRRSDDEPLANDEIKRFRALKKEAKTAATLQITRMERTMQEQRPVASEVFRTYFVQHPWMTHLAQRLVWCTCSSPRTRFRVAEDGTFATVDDEPFELGEASVTVAHPLNFADGERERWVEVFADYELLQPFQQLERPVFGPQEGELATDILERFQGRSVHFNRLRSLEGQRWYRWIDDSVINGMAREVAPGVQAVLFFEPGWSPGYFDEDTEEQALAGVHLFGAHEPKYRDISDVAFSELIHAIEHAVR